MGREKKHGDIYVCHTYYHVYVSMLKEFAKPKEEQGKAVLILSTMSNDFEQLPERMKTTGVFREILMFEEKAFTEFPELMKLHHPSKFFPISIWNRFLFTKKYGKLQASKVPVDFTNFENIYVYCDSDPIGYYLNWKHIYYHAVEDGLDTLRSCDSARADNESHFGIKTFLSKKMNIIFIQNGYGRYCLDMEVNDISVLKYPCPYYVEKSRNALASRLLEPEKELLCRAFVKDADSIERVMTEAKDKVVLILTEPLCDLVTRKRLFDDLIHKYQNEYVVILKQHPRDLLDYEKEFPDILRIDRTVPMELLNYFPNFQVDLVVSIFTELGAIGFAKNKLRFGRDFMDAYEAREVHESRFESYEK